MTRLGRLVACLAFVLRPGEAAALNPRQSFDQYVQARWTGDGDLPQRSVIAITQTPDGYLWAGTQEGLVRFDGVTFRTFDRQNSQGLKINYVAALLPDRAGALWIGTGGGGLTRYSEGSFRTFTVEDGLPHKIITSLAIDATGALWVGTEGGLARFSEEKWTVFRARDGLASDEVKGLLAASDGTLWVATREGVSRLKEGRWLSYAPAQGIPSQGAKTLLEDRQGRVWLGTYSGVLLRFEQDRFVQYGKAEGLTGERVTELLEDRDGILWVGTSSGLHRFAGERLELMTPGVGSVLSLFEDREGSLWVGTDDQGLLQLRSARVEVYSTWHGLPLDNVLSLHEDREGALWVGTSGGGLARLFGHKVTAAWSQAQGLAGDHVTSVYATRDGIIWVGLLKGGLNRIEGGQLRTDGPTASLASEAILSLLEDRTGRLWIGTKRGLHSLHQGALTHYGKAEGLADEVVFSLRESADGSLWVGTRGGLSHWVAGRFIHDPATQALAGLSILSLHEDAQGTLWAGTYTRGLHRFHQGRHFAFTARHGLFDELVHHILEDDQGHLWMSCNKGIFSVSKAELTAVADGRAQHVTSTVYGRREGLRIPEGNGASQPGAWKTRDGRLWFPTVGGVAMIDPKAAHGSRNRHPPSVHIEAVHGDGQPVAMGGPMRIPPGRGELEFHYTGVSFVAPEKVFFQYRLDGFDEEWIEAGTRRSARYTNLPPGKYRFRVRSANSDGVWSEGEASTLLLLEAHFYQTWWFKALLGLPVLLLGWGIHRLRTQQLRAQSAVLAERNRLAREIHDGLAQSLTGVLIQIEASLGYLFEAPESAQEHLQRAQQWARHSLSEARRAIWALRPSVTSVSELTEALERYASMVAREGNVKVDIQPASNQQVPPDVGAALLRIGQEALTNAVRHGRPHRIWVRVQCNAGEMRLSLGDDGRGFNLQEMANAGGSLGLIGMRERAESLGGHLMIESKPGQGTEITAVVPLHRQRTSHEHRA
jgi:ligand-binding sensor domain-containing protein/signal transduction histidine kinase